MHGIFFLWRHALHTKSTCAAFPMKSNICSKCFLERDTPCIPNVFESNSPPSLANAQLIPSIPLMSSAFLALLPTPKHSKMHDAHSLRHQPTSELFLCDFWSLWSGTPSDPEVVLKTRCENVKSSLPRRLLQTAVNCKRNICDKIE